MQTVYLVVGKIVVGGVVSIGLDLLITMYYFRMLGRYSHRITGNHLKCLLIEACYDKVEAFLSRQGIRELFLIVCLLVSPIITPLGFLELGIRYAFKSWHKANAPAILA